MHSNVVEVVSGIGVALFSFLAVGSWVLGVVAIFKAPANRKPGVSWYRAYRWTTAMLFGRHVYLDDLFTETGKWWVKAQGVAVLGFLLSAAALAAIGRLSRI